MTDIGHPFEVYKNESNDEYGIKIYAYAGSGTFPRVGTMLIQWRKDDFNNIDTVQTEIQQRFRDAGNGWEMTLSKVSYNGDIQWDLATSNKISTQWGDNYYARFFGVIK